MDNVSDMKGEMVSPVPLVKLKGICKTYIHKKHQIDALQNVSFELYQGECLGIVGESGSGKSTIGRLLLLLEQPDAGELYWNGQLLSELRKRQIRELRSRAQIVFQDPASALNPRMPIWQSVIEPLDNFPEVTPPFLSEIRSSRRGCAARLLEMVGLAAEFMDRYPHEMSGGEKQRVAIARGIALKPELLVCDEPTSSLDVTVQAQILNLLQELRVQLQISYVLISHDIASAASICDRMLVMQEGRIVDTFRKDTMFDDDRHLYTKLLITLTG